MCSRDECKLRTDKPTRLGECQRSILADVGITWSLYEVFCRDEPSAAEDPVSYSRSSMAVWGIKRTGYHQSKHRSPPSLHMVVITMQTNISKAEIKHSTSNCTVFKPEIYMHKRNYHKSSQENKPSTD